MAEILVYNKDHWMDSLSSEDIDNYKKTDLDFQARYDRRLQRGDIVEVREDGYYSNRGFDTETFALIKVPGLSSNGSLATNWIREFDVVEQGKVGDTYFIRLNVRELGNSGIELLTEKGHLTHLPGRCAVINSGDTFYDLDYRPLTVQEKHDEYIGQCVLGSQWNIKDVELKGTDTHLTRIDNVMGSEVDTEIVKSHKTPDEVKEKLIYKIENGGNAVNVVLKRRRFKLIPTQEIETINISEFNNRIEDKANLTVSQLEGSA